MRRYCSAMEDWVEPFSEESRAALRDAARRLAEAVLHYADATEGMRGSTGDSLRLFDLNRELEAAVVALNDRAFEHSGSTPLGLQKFEDDPEVAFEEDEDEPPLLVAGGFISAVSRWDVAVTDAEELVRTGREVHLRQHPLDAEPDAELAVPDPPAALMTIIGDNADLWFHIPGVEPVSGLHVGIVPSSEIEPREVDIEAVLDNVAPPEGTVFFSESW